MAQRARPAKVCCSYSDCTLFFNSESEMKQHKSFNHEYCNRCDEDFEDEERLLIHKIKSNKHIVCPVCGVEFHSEGGRNSHIRLNHRSLQILPCHGCKAAFRTASGLMHHIESDECPSIRQLHLIQEQSKKIMIKEALNAGDGISLPIIPPPDGRDNPDTDTDHDELDGGVTLVIGEASSRELANREAMDNQPKPGQDDPTASISAMLALKHWPALDAEVPKGKDVAPSEPALSKLRISAEAGKENESCKEKELARSVPDNKGQRGPFGIATPELGLTLRMLERTWDPTDFFNSFIGEYICPCKQVFATLKEFETHVLMNSRVMEDKQCPGCFRFFKSTTALVAHFESPSARCHISDSSRYGQIVDELTGGLIQTAGYNEDGTIKYEAGKLAITDSAAASTEVTHCPPTQKW
ncbi:hypothetical protein BDV28DRAFT_163344 [Aspergillus coremiiformis]|uniref:C2H2-type domain-containing protein n=1 Tax=Aspergillus coremiiformis TaxID=138285 RepID=A0A5N6ZDH0_9EURO|nr:hypothetical protein BDV28DRAFT_163344 [Aspergillus coremiiformis]